MVNKIGRLVFRLIFGLPNVTFVAVGGAPLGYAGDGSGKPCTHDGNYGLMGCVSRKNSDVYYGGFDKFRNVSIF